MYEPLTREILSSPFEYGYWLYMRNPNATIIPGNWTEQQILLFWQGYQEAEYNVLGYNK